jgi:hypothetical protein
VPSEQLHSLRASIGEVDRVSKVVQALRRGHAAVRCAHMYRDPMSAGRSRVY